MSNQITFWELLESNKIEIPIIQRDYAQGRDDDKVKQIRKSFVTTLHEMVVHADKSKDLDFIYGSIEEGKLILLDGQQRLTTLFLLHWYLAVACSKIEELDKLKKFTYKTRITSNEFCNALTDIERGGSLEIIDEKKLSKIIEKSSWFFSIWKADPTIKSMLVMLDEIHNVFQNDLDSEIDLWNQLISGIKPPITFYFLNMHDFKLTDELYIKMNARGRPLSEFENFKAWLQEYVIKSKVQLPENFWENIDKKWTDLFWKHSKNYEIDSVFMQFFKSVFMSSYALFQSTEKKKFDGELKEVDKIIVSLRDSIEYVPFHIYEEIIRNDDIFFENISSVLNFICSHNLDDSLENILNKKATYFDHVRFYSLYVFVITANSFEEKKFQEWLRITRNLTQNIAYDSSMDFAKAVQSISDLAKRLLTMEREIYTELSAIDKNDIEFFTDVQKEEEILKADLINKLNDWESLFVKYEGNEYFYGQIRFLLEFSIKDGQYDKEQFEKYALRADKLFDLMLLQKEEKDFLLERALLTKGDYTIKKGSNWSFCLPSIGSARERNENWREVFKDEERSTYLQALLDDLDEKDIEGSLNEIINEAVTNDWRQYFIKCPEAIKFCGKKQFRFKSKHEIYLLSGVRMSGTHAELRTYIRYLMYKEENTSGIDLEYCYVDTDKEEPYIFVKLNNKSLTLAYEKMKYIMKTDYREKIFTGANPPVMKDFRNF